MHSSTSNSKSTEADILYRNVPDLPWTKVTLIATVLTLLAMIGWEMLARSMHHMPGTYQTGYAEMWGQERKKLDMPNNHRIVLTGSSRMMWASDLDILEQGFGNRPIQLALAGTSPAIFVEDIVNNTEFDGLIVVGVTPFLVNLIGNGYFGGPALAFYQDASPADISGYHLHNFLSDYWGFLDESFSLPELKNQYINLPIREGAKALKLQGWKLGDVLADRQTNMWPPTEDVGSFENQQIKNFWSTTINLAGPIPEETRHGMNSSLTEFLKPLVEKQRAKGGDILFIRFPTSGDFRKEELLNDYTNNFWLPVMTKLDAPYLDSYDYPELSSELEIPEWSHLSRNSQDKWSLNVVAHIKRTYQDFRGVPLDDLIGVDNSQK